MPNSKTTNLDLNYNYDDTDRTTVWLDGLDSNFQILDDALGTVFKAIIDAGITLSRDVELHDEWSTGSYLLSTTFLNSFESAPAITSGNYIYIFIGNSNSVGEIYKFDSLRYTLVKLNTTIPAGFTNFIAEIHQGIVYLFAGKQNNIASDSIFTFNLGTEHLQLYEIPMAAERSDSCSCVIDDSIYVFGGIDSSEIITDTIIEINLNNESSSILALSLPQPICKSSAQYDEGYIYLFGGENSVRLNTIYKIDLINDSIDLLDITLPEPLSQHKTCKLNSYIYLFGGLSDTGLKDTIYKFSSDTNSLILLNFTLPMPLANPAASATSDYIYTFGGVINTGNSTRIIRIVP